MELNEYFRSYGEYFWQWEEQMEVLSIPGGSTIAYRQHVLDTLNDLSPQGIPPFGSLLLAMMATNPNAAESINQVYDIVSKAIGTTDDVEISHAVSFLKLMAELPEQYKQGEKRKFLFRAVFENCHYIHSFKNTKVVLENYLRTPHLYKKASTIIAKRDFKPLAVLFVKYPDLDSLLRKMAALPGFPQEEIKLEPEPALETVPGDLIDELIENENTFHTGALVRRIWSGLHIPFHNHLPSQQPLGGVADLSNKGDLSRLLVSEFANDEIMLLSRLANNEALYFNREIPPENNDLKRVMLIDISLRNWGTPKTIAFAVMLAIAKHPKSKFECETFVVGDDFYPVKIDDIHGIIEGLQKVEGSANAAEGLEKFFKENEKNRKLELFFISTEDAVKSAEMQKVMSENFSRFNYWIHTGAEGEISLYKKQNSGKKHVQDLKLPLEELWKREKPFKKQKQQMPLQISEFPVLLRNPLNTRETLLAPDGEVFKITSDKNVLRFYDKDAKFYEKGWDLVMSRLPSVPSTAEIGIDANGDYILLMYVGNWKKIFLFNLRNKESKEIEFSDYRSHPYCDFIFHHGQFYYPYYNGYFRISLEGEVQKIEVKDEVLLEAYEKRRKTMNEYWTKFSYGTGVFKNISEVYVGENRQLYFNVHELSLKSDGKTIKLEPSRTMPSLVKAQKTSNTEFTFPDGSVVVVNKAGMITLRSADKTIPDIFIPSVIDNALGMVAGNNFTGNNYYYKEPLCNLELTHSGSQKLQVVRSIKDATGKGLKEIKDMVDTAPSMVMQNASEGRAAKLWKELESNGAEGRLTVSDESRALEIISPAKFFDTFISPFIEQVLDHGTKN